MNIMKLDIYSETQETRKCKCLVCNNSFYIKYSGEIKYCPICGVKIDDFKILDDQEIIWDLNDSNE